jgi:hypothetical protein
MTAALARRPQLPIAQHSTSTLHVLKCWPEFFAAILAGEKRHDLRRAGDRSFKVGDRMLLREFDAQDQTYTGREQIVWITYITSAEQPCALSEQALHTDFCILSIAPDSR